MSVVCVWLLALIACDAHDAGQAPSEDGGDDRALLIKAVQQAAANPGPAGDTCFGIAGPELVVDCIEQVAAVQVATDPDGAHDTCAKLAERRSQVAAMDGECFFRVAEAADRPTWCNQARDHIFDCRMHVFSRRLSSWIPKGAAPGDFESHASARIQECGLDPYDPRPWSAMYRWVLGAQRPLDRPSCAQAPDTFRQEACAATAVAVFHDRLSHARDRGQALCKGPLPEAVSAVPDPVLDAALVARRADDLCDPGAVRAVPPGTALPGSGP